MLNELGIEEASSKASAPSTKMEFLGILFDTEKMQLEIPDDKLTEVRALVLSWLEKVSAKRKELESLLGKLKFVGQCVRPGRLFISRMLEMLRNMDDLKVQYVLPLEFKKDLVWWDRFLINYNGVSMMAVENWSVVDSVIPVKFIVSVI